MRGSLFCAASLLVAGALHAATLTVSTDGPLKTLAAACDQVRELRKSADDNRVAILVRGGSVVADPLFVHAANEFRFPLPARVAGAASGL